ncbi:hypothetical protein AD929_13715 [Gluconobacter potus]|uniref:Uncharacterized protein n=1 Tax=Gluconobacter potus TaxID=2724927 RepID=A0A149QRA7_9PROT|nr:hypothetical protein [Gluconobacter potus]KXU99810.1 hypothetical protein AD929_13715 [Gluconobacter potus]
MTVLSRWFLSAPLAASLLIPAGFSAHAAASSSSSGHTRHRAAHGTANLPQMGPTAGQIVGAPAKPLTPAQQSALPDEGAPAPPHGYTEVEDSEAALASYSDRVRTHLPVGMPGTNAQQKTNGTNNLPSHFSIFGMPVKFNAPVQSPYEDEDSPTSYAGHPVNGQTNILVNGDSSAIH